MTTERVRTGNDGDEPAVSVAMLQARAAAEMSTGTRVAHAGLLLVSLAVAGLTASLLATEPNLPARTQVAFGVVIAMAVAWVAVAARTLRQRRVLSGPQRVTVARLAVGFSALWTIGAAVAGATGVMGAAAWLSATLAGVVLVSALAMLVAARRHVAQLEARRRDLAGQLSLTDHDRRRP